MQSYNITTIDGFCCNKCNNYKIDHFYNGNDYAATRTRTSAARRRRRIRRGRIVKEVQAAARGKNPFLLLQNTITHCHYYLASSFLFCCCLISRLYKNKPRIELGKKQEFSWS